MSLYPAVYVLGQLIYVPEARVAFDRRFLSPFGFRGS